MFRILIVEDEPDIGELLQNYLEHAGYVTRLAQEGQGLSLIHIWSCNTEILLVGRTRKYENPVQRKDEDGHAGRCLLYTSRCV